jgi:hypothetical protein
MVDYLTYYYKSGTEPFRSLSALSDIEAIRIMEDLYVEYKENILFERFKDPIQYLHSRRQTEQWVRAEFIAKGGQPQEAFPISMVLGSSKWIEKHAPDPYAHSEIRIPLSVFTESDVSFTYPDSMVSFWFDKDKPIEYYQPDYHGKIFTLSEILSMVEKKGLPEEEWETNLPSNIGSYIEAQVWNHKPLYDYKIQPYDSKRRVR